MDVKDLDYSLTTPGGGATVRVKGKVRLWEGERRNIGREGGRVASFPVHKRVAWYTLFEVLFFFCGGGGGGGYFLYISNVSIMPETFLHLPRHQHTYNYQFAQSMGTLRHGMKGGYKGLKKRLKKAGWKSRAGSASSGNGVESSVSPSTSGDPLGDGVDGGGGESDSDDSLYDVVS